MRLPVPPRPLTRGLGCAGLSLLLSLLLLGSGVGGTPPASFARASAPAANAAPRGVAGPTVQLFAQPATITLGQNTTLNTHASGGTPPYTYAYSGLPPGCSASNVASLACTPSSTGAFSPLVKVTDNTGANATASTLLTVNVPPLSVTASVSPSAGPAPLPVQFSGGASGGTAPYTWAWAFGDGGTSVSQSPSYTYNAPGNYTAWLNVTDSHGVKAGATTFVEVGNFPPTVHPTAMPTTGPSPLSVTLNANISGGTAPFTVTWAFGDGTAGSGVVTTHDYQDPGYYNATATVVDSRGYGGEGTVAIYVAPSGCGGCPLSVVVGASPAAGSAPLDVQFWANASGGVGPYTTTWSFGDGGNGTGNPVTHAYTKAGNYTALATVRDTKGDTATGTFPLRVAGSCSTSCGSGGAPVLQLSVLPSSGTAPVSVNVTVTLSGGTTPYSLTLAFGDGGLEGPINTGAGALTFPHQYTSAGTFTIRASVTDAKNATSEASIAVVASAAGSLQVTASETPRFGSAPLSVAFVASVEGGTLPYTLQWTFGDGENGSSVSGSTFYESYASPGTYTPWLHVTDGTGRTMEIELPYVEVNGTTSSSSSVLSSPAALVLGGAGIGAAVVGAALALVVPRSRRRQGSTLREQGESMVHAMEADKAPSLPPAADGTLEGPR